MLWEDYKNGMWRKITNEERQDYLLKAISFTGNTELYGSWMLKVIEEWPYTCEQNLTDNAINQQAFIGHCACCLAIGCPEDITREAWWHLTQEQQDKANLKADYAIFKWKSNHIKCLKNQLELMF